LVLDELQKCLPAADRAVLLDCSHELELENPAVFNDVVLAFLTRQARNDAPR
jgi:pimeloyl-ACP methyl ester carboxylesterase